MATFYIACQPDIKKPIGGVKQLHRAAECITSLGHQCCLVQDEKEFHPGWFASSVNRISAAEFNFGVGIDPLKSILVLPETYIEAIGRYPKSLPKIIFNQNLGYTFNGIKGLLNPEAVREMYLRRDVAAVWCVSDYDFYALSTWLGGGKKVARIINAIDSEYFDYKEDKERLIAYMPRKNREHGAIVEHLLKSYVIPTDWNIVAVANMSAEEVGRVLSRAAIFLSFGHPEGFGLPIAESLATGAYVIGYTGMGGRELFHQAGSYGMAYEIEYGDWFSFPTAVQAAITAITSKTIPNTQREQLARLIRERYSIATMKMTVKQALIGLSS